MNTVQNKVPLTLTLAGGGSTFTAGIVKALLMKKEEFPLKEIRLYDIDGERQRKIGVLVKHVISQMAPDVKLVLTTDPQTAFSEADFIFAQIRVGQYAMREYDEKIPLRNGVVGQETCGPGGLAYGLRTIFPMIELIDYMDKYSKPSCWMVNYSNPAAIVAEAVRRLRPTSRVLNICDMPVAIQRNMADILNCQRQELDVEYFGLNHYGWFTSVKLHGKEMLPQLKEHIKQYGLLKADQSGDKNHAEASWLKTFKNASTLVQFFPEYIPNTYMQYYLLADDIVAHSNPNHTRANEVMEGREKKLFETISEIEKNNKSMEEGYHVGVHGEFIVDVAMSLAYDLKHKYLVIVENNGIISNIANDAMVEVPALLTKDGPVPVRVGEISEFYCGMINQQLACEKCLVDAAIEGSYDKALQAFTLNKTIPSALVAKKILDEMIEANKNYWPELK